MAAARESATRATASKKASAQFTPEERAAMRDRVRELKAENADKDGERAVLEKIAEMQPSDRAMAKRLHALIRATAPGLTPRLWYGMPAYGKGGGVLCFFRGAEKFKTRYATFGFSDKAKLDEGSMWPTDFALTKLTDADEKRIAALV